ncbi:MAG: GxxExxY protein [Candidatus Hydrogenedentota bacterium]|nr:MAG: GxxExxY protein [Candidatus Hydrogenedentota bacterium]
MPDDPLTYQIIGAAMEVHTQLGCGFLEAVYHEALQEEFRFRNIPFQSEVEINITYKEKKLQQTYRADFICFDSVIVELKALSKLSTLEESQVINYLKASSIQTGLLLNFGATKLEYKRMIWSNNKNSSVSSA